MAENESKSIEEQKRRGPFAVLQDFLLNFFSQFNKRENKEVVVVAEVTNKNDGESKPKQKPDSVKLPDAPQDFSSLKLKVEESEQETGGGNHIWQVSFFFFTLTP